MMPIWFSRAQGTKMSALVREELFAGDGLAAGVAGDAAVGGDVILQLVGVEALGVGEVPAVVADGDGRDAELAEDGGGVRAHVAEALDHEGGALEVEVLLLGPLGDAVDDALAGGLLAAEGAAAGDGLAGDDALDALLVDVADGVGVGVHGPGHGLAVGADVGRGDVKIGADVAAEREEEAAGDALELGLGEVAGVALHAALAATVGEPHQRALPGHHGGERLAVIEGDIFVVADAALEGPQDVRVLDAVALEEADVAVIHAHREVDDDLVLGLRQDGADVRLEADGIGGLVEVALDDLEEVVLLRLLGAQRRDRRCCPRWSSWGRPLRRACACRGTAPRSTRRCRRTRPSSARGRPSPDRSRAARARGAWWGWRCRADRRRGWPRGGPRSGCPRAGTAARARRTAGRRPARRGAPWGWSPTARDDDGDGEAHRGADVLRRLVVGGDHGAQLQHRDHHRGGGEQEEPDGIDAVEEGPDRGHEDHRDEEPCQQVRHGWAR